MLNKNRLEKESVMIISKEIKEKYLKEIENGDTDAVIYTTLSYLLQEFKPTMSKEAITLLKMLDKNWKWIQFYNGEIYVSEEFDFEKKSSQLTAFKDILFPCLSEGLELIADLIKGDL